MTGTKWLVFWILCLVALIVLGFFGWLTAWIFFGGFVLIITLTVCLIYFFLAPNNLFFCFVQEGTAKIITRGGQFHKLFISWEGQTFRINQEGPDRTNERRNWEVVKGKEPYRLFGGLRFFFFPFQKVYAYQFSWSHVDANGNTIDHSKQWLDYVYLKKDLYVIEYSLNEKEGVEDIDGVPLGVRVIVPMRIINPYYSVFVVKRWLPLIAGTVKAVIRSYMANFRYKEDLLSMIAGKGITKLQKDKGIKEENLVQTGDDLKENLRQQLKKALIKEAEQEEKLEPGETEEGLSLFGVHIVVEGIDILNIDPSVIYREETTKKYRAEKDAEKLIIDAKAKTKASKEEAKQKAYQVAEMYRIIYRILTTKNNLSSEDAKELTAHFVEYWKGSEEKVIRDWRMHGGANIMADIARYLALGKEVAKEIESQSDNQN